MSHAISAFFPSPFEEATILIIDGVGEWACTTIAKGKNNKIKLILKIFGYSLVAIIFIIGFVISPDRLGTKFIETAKGMSILAIPGAILVGVMNWRSSKKRKQSSTENIDKQGSEDTNKSKSVFITADGKVIRKSKDD